MVVGRLFQILLRTIGTRVYQYTQDQVEEMNINAMNNDELIMEDRGFVVVVLEDSDTTIEPIVVTITSIRMEK